MKLSFNRILAKFNRKSSKDLFPKAKHIIKPAFVCAGKQYFEFDSLNNLPWKRGLKFLAIYAELDMKCDKFYLEQHCKAVNKLLTGGTKIGLPEISEILKLNNQMLERLKMIYHEDLIYKIASVVFFDETENPDDWEWKYALEKINIWKANESALTFFLHTPIVKLMPYLKTLGDNIPDYSEAQKALDSQQLENIYAILYGKAKKDLPTYTERYFSEEMKASLKS